MDFFRYTEGIERCASSFGSSGGCVRLRTFLVGSVTQIWLFSTTVQSDMHIELIALYFIAHVYGMV